jgi:calcineurin-like phosphoesterase family protein
MRNSTPGEHWHKEHKHTLYSIEDTGGFHLHGHIHARKGNGKLIEDGKQRDVGVPGNQYKPVAQSQIESWIMKYKRHHIG